MNASKFEKSRIGRSLLSTTLLCLFLLAPAVSSAQLEVSLEDSLPFSDSPTTNAKQSFSTRSESTSTRERVSTNAGDSQQQDKLKSKLKGSLACANCHVAPQAKNILDGVEDFVMLKEYQIWLNDDPHSRAWLGIIPERGHFEAVRRRLTELNEAVNEAAGKASDLDPRTVSVPVWGESNERSQQILKKMFGSEYDESIGMLFQQMTDVHNQAGKRLKVEQLAKFTPRLKSTLQQCMSCHAGWDKQQDDFDFEIVKYGTGVSCESCHGPSADWLADHSEPEWRKMDPREKESDFGLVDTRNPVKRSQQCFACHVGSVEQGKVVTHEMYAAGHPPLPGIEIESFADQIPRHWRYLSEKKPDFEFASEFKKHYSFNSETKNSIPWSGDDEFPRTRNLLVGGVMASAYSVNLLAQSAGEYVKLKESAGDKSEASTARSPWPEFASFDCAACHHNLKATGWDRGFAGIPGRPPAQYWPRPLSKLGLAYLKVRKQSDLVDEFEKEQAEFQQALDRQPFGDPEELLKQGSKYSNWLRDVAANGIQSKPLTSDDANAVLCILCGCTEDSGFSPDDEVWDFHSARQLAWAINLVYSEMQQPRGTGNRELTFSDQQSFSSEELAQVMIELRKTLMLDLPTTGEITTQQTEYLTAWREFDRKEFIQQLTRLRSCVNQ